MKRIPAYGHGPWLFAIGACLVGLSAVMFFLR
jgi:hypothetical protein